MIFNDAKKEIDEALDSINYEDMANKIEGIVDTLRQEYAPTIDMTLSQKENLLKMKENKFSLIEIVAEFDDGELINDFDSYWGNLTERKLVQAWLHPETIRVIEDKVK